MMYNHQEQIAKQRFESDSGERMSAQYGAAIAGAGELRGPDVRNSGVPYQLQSMEKNMACLIETISILHAKINPILRPQPETAGKEPSNRALGDSELSSFLARANLSLEEQIRRLNHLIQGVDL